MSLANRALMFALPSPEKSCSIALLKNKICSATFKALLFSIIIVQLPAQSKNSIRKNILKGHMLDQK